MVAGQNRGLKRNCDATNNECIFMQRTVDPRFEKTAERSGFEMFRGYWIASLEPSYSFSKWNWNHDDLVHGCMTYFMMCCLLVHFISSCAVLCLCCVVLECHHNSLGRQLVNVVYDLDEGSRHPRCVKARQCASRCAKCLQDFLICFNLVFSRRPLQSRMGSILVITAEGMK